MSGGTVQITHLRANLPRTHHKSTITVIEHTRDRKFKAKRKEKEEKKKNFACISTNPNFHNQVGAPAEEEPSSQNPVEVSQAEEQQQQEQAPPIQVDDSSDTDSSYCGDLDGEESSTASITSEILNFVYENGRRYHGYRQGVYWYVVPRCSFGPPSYSLTLIIRVNDVCEVLF